MRQPDNFSERAVTQKITTSDLGYEEVYALLETQSAVISGRLQVVRKRSSIVQLYL